MRLFKRTTPPGTAPGTLPVVVRPTPSAMRLVRFDRRQVEERTLEEVGDLTEHDLAPVEDAEEGIMEEPDPGDLNALHILRSDLLLLRKSTWPLREVMGRLHRSESTLIHDETRLYLRDMGDHVALCLDIIEIHREMVASLSELYLSAVSDRLNEVMKVLTIIATIIATTFIPLSFIAGLYGLDFDPKAGPLNMPELGWAFGYPCALLLMAAVAGGLLLFFRRKGWV
jgi:magnesium transporter